MTDFQFHQPLDEALFSFDVPQGYEVLGRTEEGKVESPAGLERAWSRPEVSRAWRARRSTAGVWLATAQPALRIG